MFLINLCGKCYLIARLVGGTPLAHGRLVHSITLLKSAHAEGIPSVIHFFFFGGNAVCENCERKEPLNWRKTTEFSTFVIRIHYIATCAEGNVWFTPDPWLTRSYIFKSTNN